MKRVPTAISHRESPRGLEYLAMLFSAWLDHLSFKDIVVVGGAAVLLVSAATEAIEGPLAQPAPDPVLSLQDPVLAEVGATAIRVSDARAQAVLKPDLPREQLPPMALIETGLVEEAADQIALANAAEQYGIDKAREIQAELALARRRILSSAYLDMIVQEQVTEDAVQAAYNSAVEVAMADQEFDLRRIQVSNEAEALELKRRLALGVPFDELAEQKSLDEKTKDDGGFVGRVRMRDLPRPFAKAVRDLPIGEIAGPLRGDNGWYLLTVDARSALYLPTYAEMRETIEDNLRESIIAQTVNEARAAVPIRLASTRVRGTSAATFVSAATTTAW